MCAKEALSKDQPLILWKEQVGKLAAQRAVAHGLPPASQNSRLTRSLVTWGNFPSPRPEAGQRPLLYNIDARSIWKSALSLTSPLREATQ